MKLTPTLDSQDKEALSRVLVYVLLLLFVLVGLLLMAVTAGIAVRLFLWAM